jgi:diguanylate cyclase (GGDEF)-like protein/PAS domain S-box-containing protein
MPHDPSSQDKLAELTGLLELMTAILRRFAGLGDQAIDAGIDEALASIGHFAGVDRSYMFLVDGEYLNNSHEWCAPGIPPEIHVLQQVPWETIHWWRPRLEAGESIYIPSVADLPETRIAERELLGSQGIRSLIVVPLMGPDQIKGFIGFDSVREHRTWSEQAILLLRAIADVIIGSLLRRDALKALHQSEQRFSTLVRRASDVVMILGDDSCLRYLGPSACQILGWDEQLAPETRYLDAVHPDERERVHDALKRAVVLPGEHVDIADHRLRCGDENYIWCQATATDLSADPNIRGIVINAHDISRRKEAEQTLRHRAMHDSLTALPNRVLLNDRLNQLLLQAQRFGHQVGVLFIDIDSFKLINDAIGHHAGDQLLVDAAQRLQHHLVLGDSIARFGGDEFVVLLQGEKRSQEAMLIEAERLIEVFTPPFIVEGREYLITASAGIAISDGFNSPGDLLRDADAAMYVAKERGGARVQCFDAALRTRLLERISIAHDLRDCESRGELRVQYQPLLTASGRRLVGAEALLRWEHPTRGLVSPGDFIPVAEETGLIVPIGTWVLDESLRQLRCWLDDLNDPDDQAGDQGDLSIAVNLSSLQLQSPGIVTLVEEMLHRHRIPPHLLVLELTESMVMNDAESSNGTLHQLRELGVALAIDDFGTGYSSLAYLRQLPINLLKIDRSFIEAMTDSERDRRVVAVICSLGHELGMETIAEGIETERQLEMLRGMRCDLVQGFHLGRPTTPEAIAKLLELR